jgi:hypothetical protein
MNFFRNIKNSAITLTLFVTLGIFMSSAMPTEHAHAALSPIPSPLAVPTGDASVTANSFALGNKELFLDGIVTSASKVIISNLTQSIVTWINSGFRGSPAFITDPERYLTDVGDQIVGNFIAGTELGFMCEPFSLDLRIALNIDFNTTFTQRNYCRLSDVVSNSENFAKFTAGDFNQGGWNSFFEISQTPSNNPLGALAVSREELAKRVARGQEIELLKLNWGEGFLSYRECLAEDQSRKCVQYGDIQTPGSVINDQLNQSLSTGQRQLELADEFNEIVGALVGQLVQTVFTQGLSSFGGGGSNYGSISENDDASLVCSPNTSSASTFDEVIWTARLIGHTDPDTRYQWSGHEEVANATTARVQVFYFTAGERSASVRATTSTGRNYFKACSSTVTVE